MTAWATPAEVRALVTVPAEVTDAQLTVAIAAASEVLASLAGVTTPSRVIVATEPCPCSSGLLTGPHGRVDVGAAGTAGGSPFYWRVGTDFALSQEGAGRGCHHDLVLPDDPVLAIEEVTVNGTAVAAADYELVGGNRLRRATSTAWTGAVRVTYTAGAVSPMGRRAVAVLAAELERARTGDSKCALPQRVQTVTRQGVTFAMLDPQTFLEAGRTGLYLVDLFLAAARSPRRTTTVTSPDVPTLDRLRG